VNRDGGAVRRRRRGDLTWERCSPQCKSPTRARKLGPAVKSCLGFSAAGPPLPAPAGAFDRARGQWLSTAFLDVLARAKQRDWERLLGVTGVDLYVPRLNFVFGEADPKQLRRPAF
jgi:hypothetical protein